MGFAQDLLAEARAQSIDDHPFIAALRERRFSRESFRIYLTYQYPMVRGFPRHLARLLAGCDDARVRCHLLANILEEEGIAAGDDGALVRHPEKSHLTLLQRCLDALGMASPADDPPTESQKPIWFERQLQQGHWFGPAAYIMVGIEGNVPRVFRHLAPYLAEHCGFSEEEIVFFIEHIEADQDHAAQGAALIDLAAKTSEDRRQALEGARKGALAWFALHRRCARDMIRAGQPAVAR